MRFVTGAIIATLLAAKPAAAQELGVFGMGGQLWDAGSAFHPGIGFTVGLFSARNDTTTRFGVRASYDALSLGIGNEPVNLPGIDPRSRGGIALDVIDGPSRTARPSLATMRLVALAPISRITRAEFSVGGAREKGRSATGTSALMSIGVSRRVEGDRPVWVSFTYEQRFNKTQNTTAFGQPSRLTRGSFRAGLFIEAKPPAERQRRTSAVRARDAHGPASPTSRPTALPAKRDYGVRSLLIVVPMK
jgi:hypothetical protein